MMSKVMFQLNDSEPGRMNPCKLFIIFSNIIMFNLLVLLSQLWRVLHRFLILHKIRELPVNNFLYMYLTILINYVMQGLENLRMKGNDFQCNYCH